MKPFLEPESVAIIGATRLTGPGSLNILENLVNAGFPGKLYPVNPNADEILGMKCYPSVVDVPEEVDLAVISTGRSVVPGIVRECTQRGVKALTIVGQGFADGDDEGKELQSEIVRIAREGGARILGPNTFGTANAFNHFTSAYAPMRMERVGIGLISQTGYYFMGLGNFVVVGKGIDLGNACDIDFADALEYFEHDPEIKLIFLHIEGIRDGRRFIEVARRVARKKPILALKTGKGDEGARAAQSHTGTLVGKDEVYDAAFKQCGVIRVSDVDEYEDLAKAFLKLPLMTGRGVGVITVTGAGGIMAIDLLEKYNLRLARLSAETLAKINTLVPSWQRMDNPADIVPASLIEGHPMDQVLNTVFDAFLCDEAVSALVLIFAGFIQPPDEASFDPTEGLSLIAEKFKEKPIVFWLYGPGVEGVASMIEKRGSIVVYPTLDRAMRALSRLNHYFQIIEGDG